MDLQNLPEWMPEGLLDNLLRIGLGLAVLIAGWIVAVVIRAAVRKGLGVLNINRWTRGETDQALDLEGWVAKASYYLILAMAFILFFNYLGLPLAAQPLQSLVNEVLAFLPNLFAGALLAALAWILAKAVRHGAGKALAETSLDEKLTSAAGMKPASKHIADVLYWLIILMFLPMILDTLQLHGMLEPVQAMMDKILLTLPNLFAAAMIGVVGWVVAGILRQLVTNLLAAAGADKLGQQAGLRGTMPLSKLLGLLVFVIVFVPVLIGALNTLQIDAISVPATNMLDKMMAAIPNIFSAGLVLAVAYFASGFVANVIESLLGGLGFDQLPEKLGIKALPESTSLSKFTGKAIVFFIMLFATVEAARLLGFDEVAGLVAMMIEFGGQVLLGVAIISVGLWIANLAHGAMSRQGGSNAGFLAGLARVAILGVVFAMGLNAMNVADEIVNGAFLLTLGAVAVAVALSFGLGGREAAGKQMEYWLGRMRGH